MASQLPGLLGKVAVQVLFKKVVLRLPISLVPFPSLPSRETGEPQWHFSCALWQQPGGVVNAVGWQTQLQSVCQDWEGHLKIILHFFPIGCWVHWIFFQCYPSSSLCRDKRYQAFSWQVRSHFLPCSTGELPSTNWVVATLWCSCFDEISTQIHDLLYQGFSSGYFFHLQNFLLLCLDTFFKIYTETQLLQGALSVMLGYDSFTPLDVLYQFTTHLSFPGLL